MMKIPDLKPKTMNLELEYVNKLLGMDFNAKEVKKLLERMRYDVKLDGKKIEVFVPPYRVDILHPMDLVEDVAIAYGYNKFIPEETTVYTTGKINPLEGFSSEIRELMIGQGFQELMTLVLTNKGDIFDKMLIEKEEVTEALNPVSIDHSVARNWLLPSLMVVLEKNKNREYPQKLFEIGDCVTKEGNNNRRLGAAVSHPNTNFSEMKSILLGILDSMRIKYKLKAYKHNSFIEGRCASIGYGFFGEINPFVLRNFGLEMPVTAFELDVDELFALKN